MILSSETFEMTDESFEIISFNKDDKYTFYLTYCEF